MKESEWIKQQDPLVQGAYYTTQGVVEEREGGNSEPYYELTEILVEFAKRRLGILKLDNLFGKE